MTSMTGSTGTRGSLGSTGNNYLGASNPNAKSGLKAPSGHRAFQQFTPEMMQLFQHLMGQLGPDSFLSKLGGGDEEMFQQMEAPALRQFSGLQGNLASRFSGMGGMGAQKSSGFQNTMNSAASDFAQQLQANRLGLQNQAIQDLMGMGNTLLQQQPYGLVQKRDKAPSFMDRWLGLAANTMGAASRGGGMGGF